MHGGQAVPFLHGAFFLCLQVRMEALICRNLDAALRNEPKPYMFGATAGARTH
jgi:hypothetical protein